MNNSCIDVYTYIQTHTQHNTTNKQQNKGTTNLVYYDKETWKSLQSIASEFGTDVSHLLWPLIQKIVAIHEGKKKGLDNFLDPNYIPVPSITDDFETKILPYLRTLNDENLTKTLKIFYPGYIFCNALLDTPPDQRRTAGFDYQTIWRKYK